MLHDYWRSSASYRVRIALSLKGIESDSQQVNLLTGEHRSAAHLARNPQGLVPVLDIDGRRLTQSLAIIEYLDETRPHPPFLETITHEPIAALTRDRRRKTRRRNAIAGILSGVEALNIFEQVGLRTAYRRGEPASGSP